MSQLKKSEIVDYCAAQVPEVPRASIGYVLDSYIASLRMALFGGRRVRLETIGTLERIATPARKGRNPATGQSIDIGACHRIRFRISPGMRG